MHACETHKDKHTVNRLLIHTFCKPGPDRPSVRCVFRHVRQSAAYASATDYLRPTYEMFRIFQIECTSRLQCCRCFFARVCLLWLFSINDSDSEAQAERERERKRAGKFRGTVITCCVCVGQFGCVCVCESVVFCTFCMSNVSTSAFAVCVILFRQMFYDSVRLTSRQTKITIFGRMGARTRCLTAVWTKPCASSMWHWPQFVVVIAVPNFSCLSLCALVLPALSFSREMLKIKFAYAYISERTYINLCRMWRHLSTHVCVASIALHLRAAHQLRTRLLYVYSSILSTWTTCFGAWRTQHTHTHRKTEKQECTFYLLWHGCVLS